MSVPQKTQRKYYHHQHKTWLTHKSLPRLNKNKDSEFGFLALTSGKIGLWHDGHMGCGVNSSLRRGPCRCLWSSSPKKTKNRHRSSQHLPQAMCCRLTWRVIWVLTWIQGWQVPRRGQCPLVSDWCSQTQVINEKYLFTSSWPCLIFIRLMITFLWLPQYHNLRSCSFVPFFYSCSLSVSRVSSITLFCTMLFHS